MLWSSLHLPALVAYKQLKGMLLSLESMFKEFHLLHRTPFLKIKCVNADEFATFVNQADFAYFFSCSGVFQQVFASCKQCLCLRFTIYDAQVISFCLALLRDGD